MREIDGSERHEMRLNVNLVDVFGEFPVKW